MNNVKEMKESINKESVDVSSINENQLTNLVSQLIEDIYQQETQGAIPSLSSLAEPTPVLNITENTSQNTLMEYGKEMLARMGDLHFAYDDNVDDAYHPKKYSEAAQTEKIHDITMQSHYLDVEKYRNDFPILKTKVHGRPLIWFDNAATTQKPQVVIDTIKKYYEFENSNIHRGNHYLSMQATEMYEGVRKKVAQFIHADSEKEIIFVRGTTEGTNLVANTFGKKFINRGDEIIITMLEHHSNILPWQVLCEEKGVKLHVVPINKNGDLLLDEYIKLINKKTKLVAFAHVSNALGTVLPVDAMIQIAKDFGAYVLIDGAQAVAHFPVNVSLLNCDFYVFSGHKLFGPTGIGVVYGKSSLLEQLPPWQVGGGMIEKVTFEHVDYAESPYRFEAGTASIASAAGLGSTLDYISTVGLASIKHIEHGLMAYAQEKLSQIPGLSIIGNPSLRVGSLPFVMEGIETKKIGSYLDQYGIALRAGHHCAQPLLRFFGFESVARASFAFYNTYEEIDFLAMALEKLKC